MNLWQWYFKEENVFRVPIFLFFISHFYQKNVENNGREENGWRSEAKLKGQGKRPKKRGGEVVLRKH